MTSSLKSPFFFLPMTGLMKMPSVKVRAVFWTYSWPMWGVFRVWKPTTVLQPFSLKRTRVSRGESFQRSNGVGAMRR